MKKVDMKKENKVILISSITLLVLTSFSYFYADSKSIISQGLNFWKALFDGDIINYYSKYGSAWGIIEVFFMSIWKLPFYVIEVVFKIDIFNYFVLRCLAKMDLIIYAVAAVAVLKKILNEYRVNEATQNIAKILFLTSSLLITSICICGQVDIIGLFFSLLAYLYLIKNDEKRFFIFILIAIQCKFFPLFIFIPIILYRFKKAKKYVLYLLVPLFISVLLNVPFSLWGKGENVYLTEEDKLERAIDPDAKQEITMVAGGDDSGVLNEMLDRMFSIRINFMGTDIPIIFFTYGSVCILAFLKRHNEDEEKEWLSYWGFTGICVFLISYPSHLYRMVYLLPFSIILVYQNGNWKNRIVFHLETVGISALTLGNIFKFYWCSDFNITKDNLVDLIIPERKFSLHGSEYYYRLLINEKYYSLWTVLYAFFLIWCIYMIIINYPNKKFRGCLQHLNDESSINDKDIVIRAITNCLVANFIFVIYFISIIVHIINLII